MEQELYLRDAVKIPRNNAPSVAHNLPTLGGGLLIMPGQGRLGAVLIPKMVSTKIS